MCWIRNCLSKLKLLGDSIYKWECNTVSNKVDSIILHYNFILLTMFNLFVIFLNFECLLKITN